MAAGVRKAFSGAFEGVVTSICDNCSRLRDFSSSGPAWVGAPASPARRCTGISRSREQAQRRIIAVGLPSARRDVLLHDIDAAAQLRYTEDVGRPRGGNQADSGAAGG